MAQDTQNESETRPVHPPESLDYATPPRSGTRQISFFAGVGGVLSGGFALLMLWVAIEGFTNVIIDPGKHGHLGWDIDTYVLFALLFIGVLSAYLSYRLLRNL